VARGVFAQKRRRLRVRTEIVCAAFWAAIAQANRCCRGGQPHPRLSFYLGHLGVCGRSLGLYWQWGAPGYWRSRVQDRNQHVPKTCAETVPDLATAEAELPAADLPLEPKPRVSSLADASLPRHNDVPREPR